MSDIRLGKVALEGRIVDRVICGGCGYRRLHLDTDAAIDDYRTHRCAFSCGRCGDDSEPADCPDRMSFEDHGLCCLGQCLACQHRIDQGETA